MTGSGAKQISLVLLELESARDKICLVANAGEIFTQPREIEKVRRVVVGLQKVNPSHHWFSSLCKFVGNGYAVQPPIELFLSPFNKSRQVTEFLFEIAPRQIGHGRISVDRFLSNS